MKTILYATDCTSNDISVLKYAYRFSAMMKADLNVLHVYNFPPINNSIIQPLTTLKKRNQKEQKDILDTYCATHLKNEFRLKLIKTHVVENNSITNGILDISKMLSPDLVILGMKKNHSNRSYFSGNIGNMLLDKTETPIMIIPKGLIYNPLSIIVYATDFEESDIISIQKLIEIARPFHALIEIVHVFESKLDYTKENMEQFKKTLLKQVSYPEITFRNIASSKIKFGLLSVIENEKANMLAMLERNRSWSFNSLFHKDLVKDMETKVAIPILAFNKKSTPLKLQNANATYTKNVLAY